MSDGKKINPHVKDILKLIAVGSLVTATLLLPGFAMTAGAIIKVYDEEKRKKEEKELQKYNLPRLKQIVKRLEKQKMVTVEHGIVTVTKLGHKKILHYNLLDMRLKEKPDGKWRIVIYDIAELNKNERKLFRNMLKQLRFLKIQKSVYLTPFPCEEEIEYLKERFSISADVQLIVATGLENAQAYKDYFGIS